MTRSDTDRQRAASRQRKWRSGRTRIDYQPSPESIEVMAAFRADRKTRGVADTNRAVIDRIVTEWGELKGLWHRPPPPSRRIETGTISIDRHVQDGLAKLEQRKRDREARKQAARNPAPRPAKPVRLPCGARRVRDGLPCESPSVPGKKRCRFHGGMSTGPKTDAGKARSAANLPRRKGSGSDG